MKVEALLLSTPQKEPRRDITFSQTTHSVLKIPPKSDGPAYEVVAILDPTTRAAQKYTPVIMVGFGNCLERLSYFLHHVFHVFPYDCFTTGVVKLHCIL